MVELLQSVLDSFEGLSILALLNVLGDIDTRHRLRFLIVSVGPQDGVPHDDVLRLHRHTWLDSYVLAQVPLSQRYLR